MTASKRMPTLRRERCPHRGGRSSSRSLRLGRPAPPLKHAGAVSDRNCDALHSIVTIHLSRLRHGARKKRAKATVAVELNCENRHSSMPTATMVAWRVVAADRVSWKLLARSDRPCSRPSVLAGRLWNHLPNRVWIGSERKSRKGCSRSAMTLSTWSAGAFHWRSSSSQLPPSARISVSKSVKQDGGSTKALLPSH